MQKSSRRLLPRGASQFYLFFSSALYLLQKKLFRQKGFLALVDWRICKGSTRRRRSEMKTKENKLANHPCVRRKGENVCANFASIIKVHTCKTKAECPPSINKYILSCKNAFGKRSLADVHKSRTASPVSQSDKKFNVKFKHFPWPGLIFYPRLILSLLLFISKRALISRGRNGKKP